MRKWLITLLRAPIPSRVRPLVKQTVGFPVPTDSEYEVASQQALSRLLRPGDVALDVGANVGELSVVMSRLVGPAGRVYAFEANPRCVSLLKKTLRLNRIGNCTVVLGAVCDQSGGQVTLYADDRPEMHGVASSLIPSWEIGNVPKRQFVVPSIKLDDYCAKLGLAPSVVKIDVEGTERAVLAGFRQYLESGKPHLILEARSEDADGPLHYLENLGYLIAVPEPWRWMAADTFSAVERFERTVLAIHRDHKHLADHWVRTGSLDVSQKMQ